MSMVTQCPHCSTAFNVTPEQLFARDGRVRCGICREVFDGLVQLTSLEALEAGVPPPLAEAGDAEAQAGAAAPAVQAAPSHGFAPLNWPMVPEVPVVPQPQLAVSAPLAAALPAVAVGATPERDTHAAVAAPANEPRWRERKGLWAAAAAIAMLTLCGQLLYSFRSEAAAHFPQVKPALVQWCAWAHCSVPPLQQPSALAIQASDLLILDKAKPHLVQLIVTLQNQSTIDVAYPAIDLVLNDRFDHAVARRVFLPGDYLRGADINRSVIAASVTTTVRIDLDVSGLAAGGFGLLLIPAPQS
jgi:predicted Zn finger-like uncharacterized protein